MEISKQILEEVRNQIITENKKPVWTKVRKEAGRPGSSCLVVVMDGSKAKPRCVGEPSYYTTKGGTHILSPNAYSKKGRSNMVYHPSTLEIEVGEKWLMKNDPENYRRYVMQDM